MRKKRFRIEIDLKEAHAFFAQLRIMGIPYVAKLHHQRHYTGSRKVIRFFERFSVISESAIKIMKLDVIMPKKDFVLLKLMNTKAEIKRPGIRKK